MTGQIWWLCLKCINGFAIRPLHHPRAHTMDEFFIFLHTHLCLLSAMRLCYHALSHWVKRERVREALIKLQHHSKKWINHKNQRTKRRDESYSKSAHSDDDDDEVQTQSRLKWCKNTTKKKKLQCIIKRSKKKILKMR